MLTPAGEKGNNPCWLHEASVLCRPVLQLAVGISTKEQVEI